MIYIKIFKAVRLLKATVLGTYSRSQGYATSGYNTDRRGPRSILVNGDIWRFQVGDAMRSRPADRSVRFEREKVSLKQNL